MATDTLHTNSSAWPQVGNPPPNAMSPTDPNPEWEMVADDTTANTDGNGNGSGSGDCKPTADNNSNNNTTSTNNTEHVVILPADIGSSIQSNKNKIKGRPRSATIGGQASYSSSTTSTPNNNNKSTTPHFHRGSSTNPATPGDTSVNSDLSSRMKRRVLRRCVSTPDLLMSDKDHEVIVEDESDDDDDDDSNSTSSVVGESFEVVSDNDDEEEEEEGENETLSDHIDVSGDDTDEPLFMIDDEDTDIHRCDDEESATLVSTPSMDTSTAWTMASAVPSTGTATTSTGSMWGMKKSPSFAEMLAKNIDSSDSNSNNNAGASGSVGWGSDKTKTEAMLRDSHRRHHLRVKTKPKFIVMEEDAGAKTMKHAHSTGDLSQMLVGAEQERARMFGQGRKRMTKKQFSDIMEEDEEGDFVIGRGSGGGGGGGGDVLGDTDAMDFYHRKEKGSKGASNKKKLRPDEAKRKDIIMHKKDLQRKKQAESQKGNTGGSKDKDTPGNGKKKKNEKGFGGKKERRR